MVRWVPPLWRRRELLGWQRPSRVPLPPRQLGWPPPPQLFQLLVLWQRGQFQLPAPLLPPGKRAAPTHLQPPQKRVPPKHQLMVPPPRRVRRRFGRRAALGLSVDSWTRR